MSPEYLNSSECSVTAIDNWQLPHHNMKTVRDLKAHIISQCLSDGETDAGKSGIEKFVSTVKYTCIYYFI